MHHLEDIYLIGSSSYFHSSYFVAAFASLAHDVDAAVYFKMAAKVLGFCGLFLTPILQQLPQVLFTSSTSRLHCKYRWARRSDY